MIADQEGRAIPLGAGVLEVAHEFSFLSVDADPGKAAALKAGTQGGEVLELLIAVRA